MVKRTRGLTALELAFILQHHKDGCVDAAAAFVKSNPNIASKKVAGARAAQILARPECRAELERLRNRVEEKAIITRSEILTELRRIGMSNIDDFTEVGPDGKIRVVNFGKDSARDRGNLAAISAIEYECKTDEDGKVTERTKFKLWDKKEALVAAGKEIGMFVERSQQLGADGQPVNPMSAVPATLIVKFVDPKAKK